jgi:hypothetical protein
MAAGLRAFYFGTRTAPTVFAIALICTLQPRNSLETTLPGEMKVGKVRARSKERKNKHFRAFLPLLCQSPTPTELLLS